MSNLPTLVRTCARRTASTTTITLSSKSTTSSTKSSLTRIQSQQHQTSIPSSRFLSTSTITSSPAPPSPSTFPPSTQSQDSSDHQQQQRSKQKPSQSLSTTSPYLQTGTITRTGTMKSCIQITQQAQVFDPFLRKHYVRPVRMLIHDPNPAGFLVEGDVIEFGLFSASERAARLERKQMWEEKIAEEQEAAKGRAKEAAAAGTTTTTKTKKKRGGKKLERTKWRGPKMVVRRVVTPFGMGVEERWERIRELERKGLKSGNEELVQAASKKGRVGKQHASAKVAG